MKASDEVTEYLTVLGIRREEVGGKFENKEIEYGNSALKTN